MKVDSRSVALAVFVLFAGATGGKEKTDTTTRAALVYSFGAD